MPANYRILSTIHDYIGMGQFASAMTAHLVDFAQRNEWHGRQIVDLGCGSGTSLEWLTKHGYIVTGVDRSPEMLELARKNLSGHSIPLQEQEIRKLSGLSDFDLALALDVMHEFGNLRELEDSFKAIFQILKSGKLFIFDIFTIEGLVQRNSVGDSLEHDADGLMIFIQNQFDYERQIQRRDYTIFQQKDNFWERQSTFRILRAYPIQGIIGMVQRCGFDVEHVLNMELKPHTPTDSTSKVFIIAQKR